MTGAGSHPSGALAATFLKKQREGGGGTETNVGSFTLLKPIIFLPSGLWPLCQIKKGQELASFLVLNNMTILPGNGGVKMHEFYMCYIPQRDFVVTQEPVLFSYEMDVSGEMELDLQKRVRIFTDDSAASVPRASLSPRLPRVSPL